MISWLMLIIDSLSMQISRIHIYHDYNNNNNIGKWLRFLSFLLRSWTLLVSCSGTIWYSSSHLLMPLRRYSHVYLYCRVHCSRNVVYIESLERDFDLIRNNIFLWPNFFFFDFVPVTTMIWLCVTMSNKEQWWWFFHLISMCMCVCVFAVESELRWSVTDNISAIIVRWNERGSKRISPGSFDARYRMSSRKHEQKGRSIE